MGRKEKEEEMKWHRSIVLALAMLALGVMAPDVASEPPKPERWVYGETSVSGLSLDDKRKLLGVLEGGRPPGATRFAIDYSYPSKVDWRDRFGGDYTTSVKDQGGCGSCVAFAVVASIESRLEVRLNAPGLNPDLSESQAFYCGCGNCCGLGWWNHEALDYIVANGLCDESCFPYIDRDVPCEPCLGWQQKVINLTHWVGVDGPEEMKQAIADDGPISVVMEVRLDFYGYVSGVYCPEGAPWLMGLHAVEIVGYDDEEGYWIVKNSWGADWGEDGWFRIGYRYNEELHCGIQPYGYVPFVEPPVLDHKRYLPMVGKGTGKEEGK